MTQNAPLVVLDCDATTIAEEVIELLATKAGSLEQVAKITTAAMRGEYDFAQSLTARVQTLAGLPATVFAEVAKEVTFNPGFNELVAAVHAKGGKVGVISGGFMQVLDLILPASGVDFYHANTLEINSGVLTGKVLGEIVTAQTKAEFLTKWALQTNTPLAATIAVGDGANDLEMLKVAGYGVAFRAKPVLQAAADLNIHTSLAEIIPVFS